MTSVPVALTLGNDKMDERIPRDNLIQIRVAEEEKESALLAASNAGMTLSAWIRRLINAAAEKPGRMPKSRKSAILHS